MNRPEPRPGKPPAWPRHQRAFLAWLAENRHRFHFPPRVVAHTARHIDLRLEGVHAAIEPVLSRHELSVGVLHEGEWFDRLFDIDLCTTEPVAGGCRCRFQEGELEVYPSREALWRAHVFEPFLDWINTRLARARWLRLARMGEGGCQVAELIYDDARRNAAGVLPLVGSMASLDGKPLAAPDERIDFWLYPVTGNAAPEHYEGQLAGKAPP